MITSTLACEVFKTLLNIKDGEDVVLNNWGRNKNSVLSLKRVDSEEMFFAEVKCEDVSVWQEWAPLDYIKVWNVLSDTHNRDYEAQIREMERDVTLSKSKLYNFFISQFNEYHLNVESKEDFKVLLNILEAHGETLEDIGEYTAEAYDYGAETRADAAEHYLECNAFFDSWNNYCESLIDSCNESVEEFKEFLCQDLEWSNLAITTDGIVELNVV